MNQQKKYFILLSLATLLSFIYMLDRNQIVTKIKEHQSDIETIDNKLKAGLSIMDEVNTIRKNFINNIEELENFSISGSELIIEIGYLKNLARELGIIIKDLEIDPRNTFPNAYENLSDNKIKFDRQSLNLNIFGDFLDIGDFIETIENNKSPLILNNCSIFLDSLDPKGVIAQLEYVVYIGDES